MNLCGHLLSFASKCRRLAGICAQLLSARQHLLSIAGNCCPPTPYALRLRLTPYAQRHRHRCARSWIAGRGGLDSGRPGASAPPSAPFSVQKSGTNPAPARDASRKANESGDDRYLHTVGVAGSKPAASNPLFPNETAVSPNGFKPSRISASISFFPIASATHPPECRNPAENTAPKRHQNGG